MMGSVGMVSHTIPHHATSVNSFGASISLKYGLPAGFGLICPSLSGSRNYRLMHSLSGHLPSRGVVLKVSGGCVDGVWTSVYSIRSDLEPSSIVMVNGTTAPPASR